MTALRFADILGFVLSRIFNVRHIIAAVSFYHLTVFLHQYLVEHRLRSNIILVLIYLTQAPSPRDQLAPDARFGRTSDICRTNAHIKPGNFHRLDGHTFNVQTPFEAFWKTHVAQRQGPNRFHPRQNERSADFGALYTMYTVTRQIATCRLRGASRMITHDGHGATIQTLVCAPTPVVLGLGGAPLFPP